MGFRTDCNRIRLYFLIAMNNTVKRTCLVFLFAACLILAACTKKPGESETTSGTAAKGQPPKAQVEVPAQQQVKPVAQDKKETAEQKDDRGSDTELPANWPQLLSLPTGSIISRAVSRDGQDVVEFTVARPLLEVAAELSASTSSSGFKLRQADVDKYQQVRKYTSDTRQLASSLVDIDGNISGTLALSDVQPGQYFSESTHYTGEFSVPASWPSDILPVYAGSVVRELHVPLSAGGRLMLNSQTADTEAAVIAWLETDLPTRGWTAANALSRNGFTIREFSGNGYKLSVAARGNEGLTDIQYEATGI